MIYCKYFGFCYVPPKCVDFFFFFKNQVIRFAELELETFYLPDSGQQLKDLFDFLSLMWATWNLLFTCVLNGLTRNGCSVYKNSLEILLAPSSVVLSSSPAAAFVLKSFLLRQSKTSFSEF